MEIKSISAGKITWSENAGVRALRVEAHADGGFDPDAALRLTLAVPKKIEGRMADVLYSACWCRPDFGKDFTNVPERTQGLLWKEAEGKWGFILPLAHGDYVTALSAYGSGPSAVTSARTEQSVSPSQKDATVAVSSPFTLLSAVT